MNIKLALVALFCSVAMSCSVSEGQLLDRMLSKAGCSVCDCGTNTGCSDGLLSGGCASPGILDKIKGRLAPADAGCGCEMPVAEPCGCEAAPEPCGCEAPIVEASPCDAGPSCGDGPGLLDKLKARLSSMGSGCGCAAPAPDCGCVEAPIVFAAPAVESCGCEVPAPACGGGPGLLDKLKGRLSSLGSGAGCAAPVADCGCEAPAPAPCGCEVAPAPVAEPCGCEAAPVMAAPSCGGSGGGLLDRLKGRLSSLGGGGGCGCEAAPVVEDCGCSAPVAAPCVTPVVAPAPVCEAAPAAADCGCGEAAPSCGGERPRLSLLDRLRGNRIPRDRNGRVIGGGCNDGCNPPCPNTGSPCDSGCGCGAAVTMAAPMDSGCSSCGGAVMAAPMAGDVIYGDATPLNQNVAPVEAAPVISEPIEPAPAGSDVIEEAEKADETPAVDPNAFIIRKGKINS